LISILGAKFLGLQSRWSYYSENTTFKELVKSTPLQGRYLM